MRNKGIFIVLTISLLVLVIANIFTGSVHIDASQIVAALFGRGETQMVHYIVIEHRLPQAITALLTGASLGVTGLMMQTVFRNPLAGPSILGVNSGASLGVAIVMLCAGGTMSALSLPLFGMLGVVGAAFVGAMLVMALIIGFSTIVRSNTMLLIVGIMVGYVVSSAISLLNYFATAEGVQSYLVWGLGNFGGVSLTTLPLFSVVCLCGLSLSVMMVKPLNALLLGEHYAENLGINVHRTRIMLLLASGLLTAITTAFCGPIAFLGLAVPHIARLVLGTSNHKLLLPATMLCGASLALLCNCVCNLPSGTLLPLNVITPVIGAPVIIYVIVRMNK